MKSLTITTLLFAALAAGAAQAADHGDRVERRFDKKGDHIDARLDRRGERFYRRRDGRY